MTSIVRWRRLARGLGIVAIGLAAPGSLGADPPGSTSGGGPIKVCATTPDLGSIIREIGADNVQLTVFAKGTEDPHFLEARPSFVKAASEAEYFVMTGLDLEVGWSPAILQNARNPRLLSGGGGIVDASSVITPLEIPTGAIDRSMGDVHPTGNPHYLTDPLAGVKVARLITDKLSAARPDLAKGFEERFAVFRAKIMNALAGEALASKYDVEKLALLFENGKLEEFLKSQGQADLLGGWFKELSGHPGAPAVADHNLWAYFAKRFDIRIVGFLEPKPGVAPTTSHLKELVTQMKAGKVMVLLASPYFDQRHIDFVARETGASTAALAHQVGARPNTDDYLAMCDANVKALAGALRGKPQ